MSDKPVGPRKLPGEVVLKLRNSKKSRGTKMTINQMWWLSITSIILTYHLTTALRCYTCLSSSDKECKYLQKEDTSSTIECADGITECYTFLLSVDGQVGTSRGCLTATTTNCDSSEDSCHKCTQERCNSAQLDFDRCASCDSSTDAVHCEITSNLTEIVSCGQAPTERAGCYRYSDSWDGVVKRGCVADLDEETFGMCSLNEEKCKICIGSGCNLKGEQVLGNKHLTG